MKRTVRHHAGRSTEFRRRRAAFEAISAVEGLRTTQDMRETYAAFDREGWSHERRRAFVIEKFKKVAR